jgi:putative RecB family exonuclease
MASTYSYSKIDSFNQCRLKFKYRYIDNLMTEIETIEAFMGSRVHEVLKEFYDFIKNKVLKPKEWLVSRYDDLWNKNYKDSIKIVKKDFSAEDYCEKGKKCLLDYYEEYEPFDQTKIVKTEEPIRFTLTHNGEEYPFFGILDRLDWNDEEKIFEIHDYKTSATLVTQENADADLQLPLYQLAIMSKWPEAKKARLIWHFLLFNKQIESFRTKEQLKELQEIVVNKITEIEVCKEFPPFKSALCDWCDFQEICPVWKHPKKMERMDINEYKKDPGVKLVSKYAELEEEKTELKKRIFDIEEEQAKIGEAAIELAEKDNLQVIDGPDKQLFVTIKDERRAPTRGENPEKWENLRSALIIENRYQEVSTVNNNMLNMRMKGWPQEFIDKIKDFLIIKVTKRVNLKNKI